MTVNSIPQIGHPVTGNLRIDPTWYRFLRELDRETRDAGVDFSAEIEALARKLGSPDGTIAGIPAPSDNETQVEATAPILAAGNRVSLATVTQELSGELQGFALDAFGRVIGSRPVVAGAGITIDGTTDPDQIEISSSGGGGSAVPIQEEGSTVTAAPTAINFVGAGATVTDVAGVATVTIPGSTSGGSGPAFVGRRICAIDTQSIANFGLQALSQTGTSQLASLSDSTAFASRQRYNINATASATAVVGLRPSATRFIYRSTGTGIGGFKVSMELGVGTGGNVASHRFFMGIGQIASAPTDVDTSTRTNLIGLGYDSADTNVQIIHNDGSGTATKVDLGASFPKPSAASINSYQLTLQNVAGSGNVTYAVREISTGNVASGTLTTDLPSVAMDILAVMSAGGTSTAIGMTFSWFTVEI